MRKLYSITAACVALLCASSCVVDSNSRGSHELELGVLADNQVNDVIVAPVMALVDCLTQEMDVFDPDFSTTVNGVFVQTLSAEDSLWIVSNAYETDLLQFESEVKMLPPNSQGLNQWQCSGSGTYYENSAYKAVVETLVPAGMYWKTERTATAFSFNLCMSGQFRVATCLRSDNSIIERCSVTYKDSKLDDNNRTYELKME